MAKSMTTGLNDVIFSMEELRSIPFKVISEMLVAAAPAVVDAQKKQFAEDGLIDRGNLSQSPGWVRPQVGRKGGGYLDVGPQGTNHTGGKGGESNTTNAEVAFVHEFGAPGRNIRATQSIRIATEESADKAVEEKMKVYDEWLTSLGL